jgi:hypothetical protein
VFSSWFDTEKRQLRNYQKSLKGCTIINVDTRWYDSEYLIKAVWDDIVEIVALSDKGNEESIMLMQDRYKLTNNKYGVEAKIRTPGRVNGELYYSFRLEEIHRFYNEELAKRKAKQKEEELKKIQKQEHIEGNQLNVLIHKVKQTVERERSNNTKKY